MSWGGFGFFPSRMLCLFSSEPFISYMCVLGLHGQVFIVGGSTSSGFCEKLVESSPVFAEAKASWLQDRPASD